MNIAVTTPPIDLDGITENSENTRMLKLGNLVPFPHNPRQSTDEKGITDLSYALVEKGQIQNLVVRPRNGVYEVYVGFRRYSAFKEAAARGDISEDHLVRCDIRDCDDNEAFLIALAENVNREDMSPLEECVAINKAIADGSSPKELSRALGKTTREIEALAAVASMPAFVHELLSANKRNLAWATSLARLSATQLNQVGDSIATNENSYATIGQILALAKSGKIPVSHALFDVISSKLDIDHDLFGGDSTFADNDAFWILQNAAVEAKVPELEDQGHQKVTVLHGPFPDWKYHVVDSPIGAEALICVANDGFVSIHDKLIAKSRENVLDDTDEADAALFGDAPPSAQAATNDPEESDASEADSTDQSSISNTPPSGKGAIALARWRRDSVAVELINNPGLARRVELAAALGDQRLPQTAKAPTIDIPAACPQSVAFDAAVALFTDAINAARAAETPFAYALSLSDGEVDQLLAIATAIRLPNQKGRQVAFVPDAIAREIALEAKIDHRLDFIPNEAFFEPFGLQDLRSLAAALLGGHDALQARNASRPAVTALLCQRFDDAANNRIPDQALAQRLTDWVPEYF